MEIHEFADLHTINGPLILYNVWDAGSAVAVAKSGAKAIATGSLSLAGAQGYDDGEYIPFERVLETTRQIALATSLPLTVDFERGFTHPKKGKEAMDLLAKNAAELRKAGAIGCNLEDGFAAIGLLTRAKDHAERVKIVADADLFVNARTDVFLIPFLEGGDPNRKELVDDAIERGKAYAKAGAGCFFIPGLSDLKMIEQIVDAIAIPVNVMRLPGMVENSELKRIGVDRISYGPSSWREAMAGVEAAAKEALTD